MTERDQAVQQTGEKPEEQQQGSSGSTANAAQFKRSNEDEVDQKLAEGHKLMLSQSYEEAANVLSDSVNLVTKYFGDFAPQSFFPFFNYGKALIEVARLETLPFKAPLDKIDETDDEEEDESGEEGEVQQQTLEEILKQNGEAKKDDGEGGVSVENLEIVDETQKDANENGEKAIAEKGTNEAKLDKPTAEGDRKEEENGEEEEETDEGEENDGEDIQIAWETLEIARKICELQMVDNSDLWAERKSDVLVALGDCMSVSENFPLALNEFTEALEIRKKLFGTVDRRVSESHFWIARTHKLMDNFKLAAEAYGSAKKVLEEFIEVVKAKAEPSAADQNELEELKGLVSGVEEQIQDAIASAEQQEAKSVELNAAQSKPAEQQLLVGNPPAGDEAKQAVDDITDMIKRKPIKRCAADGIVNDEVKGAKQAKMHNELQNGTSANTNGHVENGGAEAVTVTEENGIGHKGGEETTIGMGESAKAEH